MARRPRVLFDGAIYHITFRGNDRQNIFVDTRDRRKLLEQLEESCQIHQVKVLLYCLMSNHVHLLIETPKPNLDRFMGRLLTSYSVYFNRRHQRSGHVMQGRYGAQVVSGDTYLLNCSRYIHLNPVKTTYWENQPSEERIHFMQNFLWSSYRTFIGLTPTPSWLHSSPILALIPNAQSNQIHVAYQEFVENGLRIPDLDFQTRIKSNPLALGSDDFVLSIKNMYNVQAVSRIKSEDAVLRKEMHVITPEVVMSSASQLDGFHHAHINQRRFGNLERCLVAMALQKFSGLTQREVASMLNVSTGAAVSSMITKRRNDPQVTSWMEQLNLYFKG